MLRQEFLYCFGLVGRKIVWHDVDFLGPPRLAEQLIQKGDELGAGVLLGRFTVLPSTLPVFTSRAAYNESVP